jgi:hypothetical protein
LFCIALVSRIKKEERRRRAGNEMKIANGNFQLYKFLKIFQKRAKTSGDSVERSEEHI